MNEMFTLQVTADNPGAAAKATDILENKLKLRVRVIAAPRAAIEYMDGPIDPAVPGEMQIDLPGDTPAAKPMADAAMEALAEVAEIQIQTLTVEDAAPAGHPGARSALVPGQKPGPQARRPGVDPRRPIP